MYLKRKRKLNDAVKALQFYRNSRRMSDEKLEFFKNEMGKLIDAKLDNTASSSISWTDFRKFIVTVMMSNNAVRR